MDFFNEIPDSARTMMCLERQHENRVLTVDILNFLTLF